MSLTARAIFLAVLAAACLTACDDAPAPGEPAAPAAVKPAAPGAALPAQMVAAVSSGKTATAISVHFTLGALPLVGKPLPVDIAVVPHQPFNSVHAFFEAPDALALATGERLEQIEDVKAESIVPHKLLLNPREEGVFLISAAVETEDDEGTITRIYSIPVIVNAPAPAEKPAAAAPTAGPAG
jgi:hypothetical protein